MNLLSAGQIREWDKFTMMREPISSLNLMERASRACCKWILQNTIAGSYYVFCGKGNNGGDGMAISRFLHAAGHKVLTFILENGNNGSDDFNANFNHLRQLGNVPITLVRSEKDFPNIPQDAIIIDALFGTGLNRHLNAGATALVSYLNELDNIIISIDMPSGMFCDQSSKGNIMVRADYTLTFQCLKMAFLIPENEPCFGKIQILDINLHPEFLDTVSSRFQLINKALCTTLHKPRKAFAHKGNFGHALLVAGSYGKMGAAVLSARACLRSGVGLLTCHVPSKGVNLMQTCTPEAMCIGDPSPVAIQQLDEPLETYTSIGVGPGIGQAAETASALKKLLENYNKPMVLDADALNIIAMSKELLTCIPENSILTPHPKEFTRLFGKSANDFEKIETAIEQAATLKLNIVLKGHHTFIATPGGMGYFNITGNAGMATGGSGDVLTGLITGLLAQGYTPVEASIMGVFLHGLAGDLAAADYGMEAMTAGDIVQKMPEAFKTISNG
ncbi:MAG: NAD(P)H-hydrate dehydratase [Niabella sp.]